MAFTRLLSSSLRSTAARSSAWRSASSLRSFSAVSRVQPWSMPKFAVNPRFYSAASGLNKEDITARILDVLKSFEKVKPEKLTTSASFAGDLGLDSLDAVEVVMAIEEEFAIEIPDAEADEITTVQQGTQLS
ncbi:hypothetical protein FRC02_008312 [Tulasnella sp. 418]|nr:hypothetical protein FRC02_008312 [Tulasnella sp. 418]